MRHHALTVVPVVALLLGAFGYGQTLRILETEGEVLLGDGSASRPEAQVVVSTDGVLRTGSGRARARLRDGTIVSLGPNSAVRVSDNHPYNVGNLEVIAGSTLIGTRGVGSLVTCEDSIRLSDQGVYRITVRRLSHPSESTHCEFRVIEGSAAVELPSVTAVLTTGQMMSLNRRCGDMIPKFEFDITALDEFERWAGVSRRDPR